MKILVTGGSGYIASHIISLLLQSEHEVNTTVRDLNDKEKTTHLKEMSKNSKGTLNLFEADLIQEGVFDEAAKDCDVVIHSASPFKISGIKNNRKQLIEPAVNGTRNVLMSVNRTPSVKKLF